MKEVINYATEVGVQPTTVVQRAGVGGGAAWSGWRNGKTCSMSTADRLRRYMQDNPASSQGHSAA